jgi:hypothetical protein
MSIVKRIIDKFRGCPPGVVAQACNPSYSKDWEDRGVRSGRQKVIKRPPSQPRAAQGGKRLHKTLSSTSILPKKKKIHKSKGSDFGGEGT